MKVQKCVLAHQWLRKHLYESQLHPEFNEEKKLKKKKARHFLPSCSFLNCAETNKPKKRCRKKKGGHLFWSGEHLFRRRFKWKLKLSQGGGLYDNIPNQAPLVTICTCTHRVASWQERAKHSFITCCRCEGHSDGFDPSVQIMGIVYYPIPHLELWLSIFALKGPILNRVTSAFPV